MFASVLHEQFINLFAESSHEMFFCAMVLTTLTLPNQFEKRLHFHVGLFLSFFVKPKRVFFGLGSTDYLLHALVNSLGQTFSLLLSFFRNGQ